MIGQIAKWNFKRNELKLNEELEEQMLVEEEAEFADAYKLYLELQLNPSLFNEELILNTVVDMVDGYCDYMYVYYGGLLKRLGTGTIDDKTQKQTLMSTILMEVLVSHGIRVHEQGKIPFLDKAMQLVMDANDNKPVTKTKGKVTKGKAWRDPKDDIKALLQERGFNSDSEAVLAKIEQDIADAMKPAKVIDIKDIEGTPIED